MSRTLCPIWIVLSPHQREPCGTTHEVGVFSQGILFEYEHQQSTVCQNKNYNFKWGRSPLLPRARPLEGETIRGTPSRNKGLHTLDLWPVLLDPDQDFGFHTFWSVSKWRQTVFQWKLIFIYIYSFLIITSLFYTINCVMRYKYNYVEWYIHGCVDLLEEATHWWHFLNGFTLGQANKSRGHWRFSRRGW
jgi:hypothetical protein